MKTTIILTASLALGIGLYIGETTSSQTSYTMVGLAMIITSCLSLGKLFADRF